MSPTKNEIVELIYNDYIVNDTIKNVVKHQSYRDDFKSHLLMIYLNKDEKNLIHDYKQRGFTYSIVATICMIYQSNFENRDHKFWQENEIKRKCNFNLEYVNKPYEESHNLPEFIDEASQEIEQICRYKMPLHFARVFRLKYYEGLSLRKIARDCGGNFQAITRYYNKALVIVKDNLSTDIKNKYNQWKD
jgi:DNA-directed RNA polymerase specialized sigma24 family protein